MSVGMGETLETPVRIEVNDLGVAVITLNRPAKLNAWTPFMAREYFNALGACAKNPAVRAILVTGAGAAFCAGADISVLDSMVKSGGVQPERDHRPYWFPLTVGKPIVAAIQGACFGVGLQQALCCDIRFVAADAKIATAYARRGLIAEVGISWLLTRLVGVGRALDLLLSSRQIDGREAVKLGLAEHLCEGETPFDAALRYCEVIARECAPIAMRTIKMQVLADLMSDLPKSYERSEQLLQASLKGSEFAEGVRAFLERRPVAFAGLPAELGSILITPDLDELPPVERRQEPTR